MKLKTVLRLAGAAALLLAASFQGHAAATLRAPGGGTVRALLIGVDRYPKLPESVQLHGAKADADDLNGVLTAAGGQVQILSDEQATRARVVSEMNRLVGDSKVGDLAIIAYSGHGMSVRAYPQWKGLDSSGAQSQIALSAFDRSGAGGHEIIVDKEMRAWLVRLDAKGVDVVVIMDACYGGHMRGIAPFSAGLTIRSLQGDADDQVHDSFTGIPMTQLEARANVRNLSHVTFLAGASENSVDPEVNGLEVKNPKATRGALSYFVARTMEGLATNGDDVTRERLFKFLIQNVKQATDERQFIDIEPRLPTPEAMGKVVFRLRDAGLPPPPPPPPPSPPKIETDPVRVAIANGPPPRFDEIKRGRAPFVRSERGEAELVWDVGGGTALSRSDLVMSMVDGTVLGGVIDRTWAIREIQKLAQPRPLDVKLRQEAGEQGKAYTAGKVPEFLVGEVHNSYLAVVDIAADGTVQLQFPFRTAHDAPHMRDDVWRYSGSMVVPPFGADLVVGISTSRPAAELVAWLESHDGKHDAADLPAVIAATIAADPATRIGTVGLYTSARP